MTTSTLTADDLPALKRRAASVRRERALQVFRQAVLREAIRTPFTEQQGAELAEALETLEGEFPAQTPVEYFQSEVAKLRNVGANQRAVDEIKKKFGVEDQSQLQAVCFDLAKQAAAAKELVAKTHRTLVEANSARSMLWVCMRAVEEVRQQYPDFPIPASTIDSDTKGKKRSR